jgi:hypothetical protein
MSIEIALRTFAHARLHAGAGAVEIVNNGSGNTLYVSRDFGAKGSPNDTADIRTLTNSAGGLPTSASGLYSAPADTLIRGVAFAPMPEPSALSLLFAALLGLGVIRRRRLA